jgi:hypothetical protein
MQLEVLASDSLDSVEEKVEQREVCGAAWDGV